MNVKGWTVTKWEKREGKNIATLTDFNAICFKRVVTTQNIVEAGY